MCAGVGSYAPLNGIEDMPIERERLRRTLLALGFEPSQRDHELFELYVGGKRVARTKLSRGSEYRTLSENVIATIARQLRISRAFLYELVAGNKTKADYLGILREQGLL